MKEFEQFKKIIQEKKSFILTTHVNPDADAIGAELALYYLLERNGKNVRIINHSPTPYYLEFLDHDNVIEQYSSDKHDEVIVNSDVHIFLDLNQLNRVVKMENVFRSNYKIKICIDHHQDPENFADLLIDDIQYTSTGEIIYDFIKFSRLTAIDNKVALCIYAAIMTDTGSFRFERTNSKTHLIAAELLKYDLEPREVYNQIYEQAPISRQKLLGRALNTLTLSRSGKIGYMLITQKDIKETGANESDVDGFVGYCLAMKDVKIGILFYELPNGFKMSFRSIGNISASKLASEFGGGGHFHASGARLYDADYQQYIIKVIDTAEKYVA
ncbi:MAG: bifunctional oligoribonuclease/PAP phosphatase NrnA [Melioribacteraceae bacterium]|nr:bifunctional oligoribonuclease/PAP phosphatase NrnA [Melioribacteraceae bacterium]MCF8355645.1 bifunctional oligoribonuclease/PAP phosphatase NrnA [Melioribacteraceae bacterium]MCF8394655.1 bifunctional oligoribonuclease/PAP phosphatase NrnA [Melioribacteraceae bacterium]MCF8418011.1 bifunctional oligoribonuclease/PAP phosphatase NrnA [Melioribacteraceae bacterium]